ncbi:hypothetical protein [Streptomyces antimycoticus]|uniref:hypothetical protein n=1 Tax=Streptomyces antimycoticus TaxID=68175 RepID=UPI0036EFCADD
MHEVDEDIRLIRVEHVQQDPQRQKTRGNVREGVNDQRCPVCTQTPSIARPTPIGGRIASRVGMVWAISIAVVLTVIRYAVRGG